MEQHKEYYAFISYNREDEKWAKWLAKKLEHYHLPSSLNGKELPKNLRPIFRDVDELSAGNLPEQIYSALSNSKNLIVICSPRSAQSEWVNKEIEDFLEIKQGDAQNIFPFIVEGEPFSKDSSKECYPKALLNLSKREERYGGNVNETGGKNVAMVKTVAGMLGVSHDSLWRRYEREQRKKKIRMAATAVIAFLCLFGGAILMYVQNQQTQEANRKMKENQIRFIAERAQILTDNGDSYLARLLLLPENLSSVSDTYLPEAEAALRYACSHNSAILRGHTAAVTSTCFSPDGNYILSSSYDGTIKLWDANTGLCKRTFKEHKGHVLKALFSSDGKRIISAGADSTIRTWNTLTGECLHVYKGHSGDVYSAIFSPDGKKILSASKDSTLRIWEVNTEECSKVLRGHKNMVECAVYSHKGKYIASASEDGTIKIWDAYSGGCLRTLSDHTAHVQSIEYSRDGLKLVSASRDSTVKIWDAVSKKCIHTLRGHSDIVQYARFSNDGKYIASASDDRTIRLWKVSTGECLNVLKGHTVFVTSPFFSPDDKRIVSGSVDYVVRIWDTPELLRKDYFHFNFRDRVISMSCSKKENTAVFNFKDSIRVYDLISKTKLSNDERNVDSCIAKTTDTIINHKRMAIFSPDGKYKVKNEGNNICVYDKNTLKRVKTFSGHSGTVYSCTFSSDGRYLASVSHDSTVKVWDFESQVCVLDKTISQFYDVAFFDNNKKLLLIGYYKSVILDFPPLTELINQTRERFKNRKLTPEERHKYYLQ